MTNDTTEPPTPSASDELLDAACEILRNHLRRHPHAADTAVGIERWWISALPPETLERALQRLVAEGLLRSRVLPSGERLWYAPQN
ncbi:hypothetical protein [Sphaerotilus microaerophilus]|uniref:Uncharacterized protein n=1 Tax=Sphaerotilus microaerophilus TaxID=2914710 RepID=A0ABM7YN85_9BURK|nr:hypothetical protein [Sphaerotilus sp. FB-5]BDI05898.1 hypothetical protein CATMQ487_28680 [Sphaerotilus sp. FB-5]